MIIALSVKNKLGFIDGALPKPEANDVNLHSSWIRNNIMVISWILNFVSKEISASIIFSDSAYDIWLDLKERFQQNKGPRIFQLRREWTTHSQNQNIVAVYFTKLKALWKELNNFRRNCSCGRCTCGGFKDLNTYFQMEYVMSFLMGLNESYAHIRGQLLLMDPIPSINKVFSLVSQEEKHRNVSSITNSTVSHPINNVAFAVQDTGVKKPQDDTYKHTNNKVPRRDRPYCVYCNYHGHIVEKCHKLYG